MVVKPLELAGELEAPPVCPSCGKWNYHLLDCSLAGGWIAMARLMTWAELEAHARKGERENRRHLFDFPDRLELEGWRAWALRIIGPPRLELRWSSLR